MICPAEGAKRYLTERLKYHLGKTLGRTAQFWFMLESTEGAASTVATKNLQLHGGIASSASEAKKVRKALRRAGGEFDKHVRHYRAKVRADLDDGIVSYSFKNQVSLIVRTMKGPPWADNPLMITKELKAQARSLYEEARCRFL